MGNRAPGQGIRNGRYVVIRFQGRIGLAFPLSFLEESPPSLPPSTNIIQAATEFRSIPIQTKTLPQSRTNPRVCFHFKPSRVRYLGSPEMTMLMSRSIMGCCLLVLSLSIFGTTTDVTAAPSGRVRPNTTAYKTVLSMVDLKPGRTTGLSWWCRGYRTGRFTWTLKAHDNRAGRGLHQDARRSVGRMSVSVVTIPCDGKWHAAGTYTAPQVAGRIRMHVSINGQPAWPRYIDFRVR